MRDKPIGIRPAVKNGRNLGKPGAVFGESRQDQSASKGRGPRERINIDMNEETF